MISYAGVDVSHPEGDVINDGQHDAPARLHRNASRKCRPIPVHINGNSDMKLALETQVRSRVRLLGTALRVIGTEIWPFAEIDASTNGNSLLTALNITMS